MVSISLANVLCDRYDITLVVTTKQEEETVFKIDDRIHIINLGIKPEISRLNNYVKKYKDEGKHLKAISLSIKSAFIMFFGRFHYRNVIKKLLTKEDDLLIASSGESYLFSPKKATKIYHYHFNSLLFFSFGDQFILRHAYKPNKFVFLSKTTREVILEKRKSLSNYSTFVYNPIRYEPELNLDYHNNCITVIGRLIQQKNPLLALRIAKALMDRNIDFKMRFFGSGALREAMDKYIKNEHLEKYVEINNETTKIKEEILKSDLLLITSVHEGFSLVRGEANALSIPVVSSNWGDTVYELIFDDINGYVIDSTNPEDYADCIEKLFSDKEKLKVLKKRTYEESCKYSLNEIKKKWIDIIDSTK